MKPRERGRRVTVVAIVLALVEVVTLVAGCLSRPGAAVVPLHLGWAFSPVSDTVTIRVAPAIEVKATRDALIDINVPFQLVASSPQVMNLNDATFLWSPPDGLNNPFSPSPIATLQADQSYTVAITSGMGCTGKATVNLRVRRRENLTVPTAFTPNGDGKNEILMPVVNDITSLNFFKIYNRWGELMFYTTEMNRGWDGTYEGKQAVSGTYVWMIEGISNEGKVMKKNGSVMLIK